MMSEKEPTSAGGVGEQARQEHERQESAATGDDNPRSPREADDPYAPGDMPLALLEFHSPTMGMVNLPMTASARYVIWIVGSLVLASIAAMGLFPVNKVVSVTGRIISTEPILVVQPVTPGRIRSINATVGQYVHKGQVLARLDPSLNTIDIENMTVQIRSLQAEVERLRAQVAGQTYHPDLNSADSRQQGEVFLRMQADYTAHMQDFDHRIAAAENDWQGARANAAMYAGKLRVTQAVLNMRQREQKEAVGSRLSTLGAQDAVMDIERLLIDAQQSAGGMKNRLEALRATREAYTHNWQITVYGQFVSGERRLDQLRSEYRKGRVQQKYIDLRAPANGIMLTVAPVSVGSMIGPTVRFMTLEPTDTGLEVEAIMSPQDGAYVQKGNHAIIKFASFPYSQYGGAEGTVRLISADTFLPPEMVEGNIRAGIDPSSMMKGGGSPIFYRVRLKIDKYTLHGQPSFFHPSGGMPVTADLDVGKRTILKYLFSRAIPVATDGMREPS